MAYQEEEQARIKRQRSKQAIALAMQGQWNDAVAANKDIITSFPNDVDAYNRLGKAYMELGEYPLAKAAYEQALTLDKYNSIAQKNLQRLSRLSEADTGAENGYNKVEPQHFIEEAGKAGIVSLYELAPAEVLAGVVAGDRVYLKVENSHLLVSTSRGHYLGRVEPKHAQRLVKLMEGGNQYSAAIVNSSEDKVTVIIHETYQDPSQAGQRSFPSKKVEEARSYTADRLIRRELEAEQDEEDEEAEFTETNEGADVPYDEPLSSDEGTSER